MKLYLVPWLPWLTKYKRRDSLFVYSCVDWRQSTHWKWDPESGHWMLDTNSITFFDPEEEVEIME